MYFEDAICQDEGFSSLATLLIVLRFCYDVCSTYLVVLSRLSTHSRLFFRCFLNVRDYFSSFLGPTGTSCTQLVLQYFFQLPLWYSLRNCVLCYEALLDCTWGDHRRFLTS